MNIGELFIKLGILPDDKKAKEFFSLLDKGKQSMLGIAAMATGTALTLDNMFKTSIATAFGLTQFAAQTDLSTTALQRWQFVASSTGVKAEVLAPSVESLQSKLAEIRHGGEPPAGFTMLGVSATGNAFDTLAQLRARMALNVRQYGATEVTNLLGGMGISGNLMPLLRMNEKDFKTLYSMAKVVGPEQIKSVEKFNYTLGLTGQLIKATFFDMFARVAESPAFSYITDLGYGIAQLIDKTIGWTNALMLLVVWLNRGALGMALMWLASTPAGWITAAALLAGWGGFDIYRAIKGKDSITGRIGDFIMNPGGEKGNNTTINHGPTTINVHTTADEKGTADKVVDAQSDMNRTYWLLAKGQ